MLTELKLNDPQGSLRQINHQTILVFSGLLMVSNTFGPHNKIDRPTIPAHHSPLAYHYLFQIVCNKFKVMDGPSSLCSPCLSTCTCTQTFILVILVRYGLATRPCAARPSLFRLIDTKNSLYCIVVQQFNNATVGSTANQNISQGKTKNNPFIPSLSNPSSSDSSLTSSGYFDNYCVSQ